MAETAISRSDLLKRYSKQLRAAMLLHLTDTEEIATLQVRPGVSFVDLELFMKNKVHAISIDRVEKTLKNGGLDVYARGLVEFMRLRKPLIHPEASYRRSDVLREILHVLEEIIQGRVSAEQYLAICGVVKSETRAILPEACIMDQSGVRPSTSALSVMVSSLVRIISENFSYQEKNEEPEVFSGLSEVAVEELPVRKRRGRPRKSEPFQGSEETEL